MEGPVDGFERRLALALVMIALLCGIPVSWLLSAAGEFDTQPSGAIGVLWFAVMLLPIAATGLSIGFVHRRHRARRSETSAN
jgi:hypothetical protein